MNRNNWQPGISMLKPGTFMEEGEKKKTQTFEQTIIYIYIFFKSQI